MARPLAGFLVYLVSRIDMAGFTYDVQYDDAILDDTFISQRKGVARFLLINRSASSCGLTSSFRNTVEIHIRVQSDSTGPHQRHK